MQILNKIFLSVGFCLGLSVQAGSAFDSVPGDSSYPPKKVLLDLAKKCQVNPATVPQGWVNMATSHGAFHQAVQALKDNESGYSAILNNMPCPVNQNGVWQLQ